MPLLTPKAQREVLGELESLAQLLGIEVVESVTFPTVMLRVTSGDAQSAITKQGWDFVATETLPNVPMTFIGGAMFKYRLEI